MTSAYFNLIHTNISATDAANVGKIHLSISGTNKDSYEPISKITVNVVAAPKTVPSLT